MILHFWHLIKINAKAITHFHSYYSLKSASLNYPILYNKTQAESNKRKNNKLQVTEKSLMLKIIKCIFSQMTFRCIGGKFINSFKPYMVFLFISPPHHPIFSNYMYDQLIRFLEVFIKSSFVFVCISQWYIAYNKWKSVQ